MPSSLTSSSLVSGTFSDLAHSRSLLAHSLLTASHRRRNLTTSLLPARWRLHFASGRLTPSIHMTKIGTSGKRGAICIKARLSISFLACDPGGAFGCAVRTTFKINAQNTIQPIMPPHIAKKIASGASTMSAEVVDSVLMGYSYLKQDKGSLFNIALRRSRPIIMDNLRTFRVFCLCVWEHSRLIRYLRPWLLMMFCTCDSYICATPYPYNTVRRVTYSRTAGE